MKKVVIIQGEDDWDKMDLYGKYKKAYEDLYEFGEKKGIKFYRAFVGWYNSKRNSFEKAWTFDSQNKKWIRVKNISPDLVWDKMASTKPLKVLNLRKKIKAKIINNSKGTDKIIDKYYVYNLFKQVSPKTFHIKNKKDLVKKIDKINSKKVVLKPTKGSGGQGIIIESKDKIKQKNPEIEDYILQEFVDTSKGIPGLVKGNHDLRMVVVDGKISYAYLRMPAKNKLLCNLHQGGRMKIVKNQKIPKQALMIFSHIKNSLKNPIKIYSIDVFFEDEKAYLIEINTKPGVYFPKRYKKEQNAFFNDLIELFKSAM